MDNLEIQPQPQPQKRSISLPVSIIIAGGIIALAVLFGDRLKTDVSEPQDTKQVKVESGNLPILGDQEAKISIIVFSDYQCPFCESFFKNVEPILRSEYIKTGKAKIAWRDFAFLGPESFWAAEAARCANDQDKFWQYHDMLFNRQNGENQGSFSKENLKALASELDLDQGAFDSCLDSGKYTQAVKDDTDYGKSIGVNGTPATFINGELLEGVDPSNPFGRFKLILDRYDK